MHCKALGFFFLLHVSEVLQEKGGTLNHYDRGYVSKDKRDVDLFPNLPHTMFMTRAGCSIATVFIPHHLF